MKKTLNFDNINDRINAGGKLSITPYETMDKDYFKIKMAEFKTAGFWNVFYLETTIKAGSVKDRAAHELIAKSIYDCAPCNIIETSFKKFEIVYSKNSENRESMFFKVHIVNLNDGKVFINNYRLVMKTREVVLSRDGDNTEKVLNFLFNIAKKNTISNYRMFADMTESQISMEGEGKAEAEWKIMTGEYDEQVMEYVNTGNYESSSSKVDYSSTENKVEIIEEDKKEEQSSEMSQEMIEALKAIQSKSKTKKSVVKTEEIVEDFGFSKPEEVVVTDEDLTFHHNNNELKKQIEESKDSSQRTFAEKKAMVISYLAKTNPADYSDELAELLLEETGVEDNSRIEEAETSVILEIYNSYVNK